VHKKKCERLGQYTPEEVFSCNDGLVVPKEVCAALHAALQPKLGHVPEAIRPSAARFVDFLKAAAAGLGCCVF
jgi:hypothetical protein